MTVLPDILARNRVMLVHFDSYSAALFFAKWDKTLLSPSCLPESVTAMSPPQEIEDQFSGEAVKDALVEHLRLNLREVLIVDGFNHWFRTDEGPVRIHLMRFDTFDPPKSVIEACGGVFKPISELRGSPREELGLAREVFNLIIGAGGGRA